MSRRASIALVFVCLGACGRIGFDPFTNGDASQGDDGGNGDAIATGPFSPPILVTELSGPGHDDDPTLTADLLEIYFNSDRTGDDDIYVSRRNTPTDSWAVPTPVTELNSATPESTPEVAPDGLTMWFASQRAGGAGDYDIYITTRASRADMWSPPTRIPELCSPQQESGPWVADGGRYAIFSSLRTGGEYELWSSTRPAATGTWSTPALVTELSTVTYDGDSWTNEPATVLYFASGRPGGIGQEDLWRAERTSVVEPWSGLVRVDELASPTLERDPWLSSDGRTIVFASDRSSGTLDLFTATR